MVDKLYRIEDDHFSYGYKIITWYIEKETELSWTY